MEQKPHAEDHEQQGRQPAPVGGQQNVRQQKRRNNKQIQNTENARLLSEGRNRGFELRLIRVHRRSSDLLVAPLLCRHSTSLSSICHGLRRLSRLSAA